MPTRSVRHQLTERVIRNAYQPIKRQPLLLFIAGAQWLHSVKQSCSRCSLKPIAGGELILDHVGHASARKRQARNYRKRQDGEQA